MTIERYFYPGALLKWTDTMRERRATKIGEVVDSTAVDQVVIKYMGHDDQFYIPEDTPNPEIADVSGTVIPHTWLVLVNGGTSRVALSKHDVLTGPMSGCPLCVYEGKNHTARATHTGTESGKKWQNDEAKMAFYNAKLAHLKDVRGFYPVTTGEVIEDESVRHEYVTNHTPPLILGLITTNKKFYRIVLLPLKRMVARPPLPAAASTGQKVKDVYAHPSGSSSHHAGLSSGHSAPGSSGTAPNTVIAASTHVVQELTRIPAMVGPAFIQALLKDTRLQGTIWPQPPGQGKSLQDVFSGQGSSSSDS